MMMVMQADVEYVLHFALRSNVLDANIQNNIVPFYAN